MKRSLLILSFPIAVLAQTLSPYMAKPEQYQKALKLQREYRETILMLKNLKIAMFPKFESIRAIVSIPVNPNISTTILFKGDWRIAGVQSSLKMKALKYFENALIVEPEFDYHTASIDVLLENSKGQKRLVKLILYRADSVSGKVLYPYVVLVDRKILSPEEVFEYYYKLTREIPHSRVEVFIDGITYFIKPVKEFGNFNYKGQPYLIGVNLQKPLY